MHTSISKKNNMSIIQKIIFFMVVVSFGLPILVLSETFLKFRMISLLLLVMVSMLNYSKKLTVNINVFILFLFSYIATAFYGAFLDFDLFMANILNMKIVLFLLFILLFYEFSIESIDFIKSCIFAISLVNVFWGVLQFVWEFFGVSWIPLNDIVFSSIVHKIDRTPKTFAVYSYLTYMPVRQRLTGFSWDPFFLGFFCNIVIIMTRRKTLKFIAVFTLFFSMSRTNYIGFFIYELINYYEKAKVLKQRNLIIQLALSILPIVLIAGFYVIFFSRGKEAVEASSHRIYYYIAPFEIFAKNPGIMLFGGSPIYAGNYYNMFPDVAASSGITTIDSYWTVESDIGNILLGRGIFGFLIYIYCFLNIIVLRIKRIDKILAFVLFISGVGYGVTQQPIVLLYIGLLYAENKCSVISKARLGDNVIGLKGYGC